MNDRKLDRAKGAAMFSAKRWNEIARVLGFSKREIQLTQAIFNEEKEVVIAEGLGLSEHTVRAHCRRIYHKLGVTNRVSLVLRIVKTGHELEPD